MTSRTLTLTDHVFALIADIKTRLADGGTAPDIKAMAERHKAVPSNIRRDLKRIEAAGLITLDPLTITDFGQTHAALWAGEARPDLSGEQVRRGDALALIEPNRIEIDFNNPRRHINDAALIALADDISTRGLLQPIGVRPIDGPGDRYRLIYGERRWRAWALSNRANSPIPGIIRTDLDNDGERLLAQLAENSQRVDLNPMDDAKAFYRATQLGLSTADIARAIGQSNPDTSGRRFVQQRIKLRELKPEDQARLIAGEISVTEARDLVTDHKPEPIATTDKPDNGTAKTPVVNVMWWENAVFDGQAKMTRADIAGRMKTLEGYDALDSDIEIAAAEKAGVITETTPFNGTQRFALLVVDGVVHPNETRASHARKARAGDMHGAGAPAKRGLTELPNGSRVAPDFVTSEERTQIEGRDSPATDERRSPDPVADETTNELESSPRELTDRQLIHEIAHHVRTGHIKLQAMRVGTDDRARRGDQLAHELFSRVYVQGQKIGTAQGESQQIGIASGGGPLIKLYGGPTQ